MQYNHRAVPLICMAAVVQYNIYLIVSFVNSCCIPLPLPSSCYYVQVYLCSGVLLPTLSLLSQSCNDMLCWLRTNTDESNQLYCFLFHRLSSANKQASSPSSTDMSVDLTASLKHSSSRQKGKAGRKEQKSGKSRTVAKTKK